MSNGDESTADPDATAELSSRRRKLLGAIGAGSVAGLAGCGGGGDGDSDGGEPTATPTATPTADEPADTDTQEPTETTAEEAGVEYPEASYSMHVGGAISEYKFLYGGAPRNLATVTVDRLAGSGAGGEWYGLVAEDWSASDTEISITFRDDTGWSNGEPVTPADKAVQWKVSYVYSQQRGPQQRKEYYSKEANTPSSPSDVVADVTWTDSTATIHAIEDWFKNFNTERWLAQLMIYIGDGGALLTPRWEVQPRLDELEALDDPWTEEGWAERREILGMDETATPHPDQDPTEWVVSGPFQVKEVTSDSITAEPNPHHYAFQNGDINFGQIDFTPMPNANVRWTNLQQDNLDGMNVMSSVPPNNVVESFPDNMDYHLFGGNYWSGISANRHRDPTLGDTYVRQAIQHSLDQQQLINVGGTIANAPLRAPVGLQDPNYLSYIPEDLANSFHEYDHSVERANELLSAGGYVKSNGQWEDLDGDPLSYEYLTSATNISQQQAMVSQMNEVGLDVTMRRVSGTILNNRVDQGDFEMIEQGWWGGYEHGFITRATWSSARNYKLNPPWTWEDVVEWAEGKEGIEWRDEGWTEIITGYTGQDLLDAGELFTWEAPPKGEYNHNVEFKEYPLAYQAWALLNAPLDESTRKEYLQNIAWVFNWDVFCMPYQKAASVAWQDHGEDWDAPTEVSEWQHNSDPVTRNIIRGNISANNNDA